MNAVARLLVGSWCALFALATAATAQNLTKVRAVLNFVADGGAGAR